MGQFNLGLGLQRIQEGTVSGILLPVHIKRLPEKNNEKRDFHRGLENIFGSIFVGVYFGRMGFMFVSGQCNRMPVADFFRMWRIIPAVTHMQPMVL
jgi:hypothetical protein